MLSIEDPLPAHLNYETGSSLRRASASGGIKQTLLLTEGRGYFGLGLDLDPFSRVVARVSAVRTLTRPQQRIKICYRPAHNIPLNARAWFKGGDEGQCALPAVRDGCPLNASRRVFLGSNRTVVGC